MNELHKELIVIFVLSEVLSAIIFTVSLYSGRSAEGMIFLLFGINLAVIGLNNGITILLVRHHVRNYMDQMNKVRMEAEHDRLTGLYNRNGFEQRAEEFLEKECPGGALLLLDLDNFKQINDREGHPEGDRVLRRVGEILNECFASKGISGRLGGDEFVLVLREVPDEQSLVDMGEEICRQAARAEGAVRFSVSVGACGQGSSYQELIEGADLALYRVKRSGKGSVFLERTR